MRQIVALIAGGFATMALGVVAGRVVILRSESAAAAMDVAVAGAVIGCALVVAGLVRWHWKVYR